MAITKKTTTKKTTTKPAAKKATTAKPATKKATTAKPAVKKATTTRLLPLLNLQLKSLSQEIKKLKLFKKNSIKNSHIFD